MSNKYKRTSTEELTAMGDELRTFYDFPNGQQFIFPKSSDDPHPTINIVNWDADPARWREITAEYAQQLIEEHNYTSVYTNELPAINSEAVKKIYYLYHLGFLEAYEKILENFYQGIIYGEFSQREIDGVVLTTPNSFFDCLNNSQAKTPIIREITVDAELLKSSVGFRRLRYLQTVNIVNIPTLTPPAIYSNLLTEVNTKFTNCTQLQHFRYTPTYLGSDVFEGCTSLLFGEGELDLTECSHFGSSCLKGTNITSVDISKWCTDISNYAFANCQNLTEIILPDYPPNLAQYSFANIPNLSLYVKSSEAKTRYDSAGGHWQNYTVEVIPS